MVKTKTEKKVTTKIKKEKVVKIKKEEKINVIKNFNKGFFNDLTIDDFKNGNKYIFIDGKILNFQLKLSIKNKKYLMSYKSLVNSPEAKFMYELSNIMEKDTIGEIKEHFLKTSYEKILERYKPKIKN